MLPDAWNKCENHRQLDIITVRQIFRKGLLLLAAASLLAACRKEEPIVPSTSTPIAPPEDSSGGNGNEERIRGFFLLNEGNMGSNKVDKRHRPSAGANKQKHIYPKANRGGVRERGAGGNARQISAGNL